MIVFSRFHCKLWALVLACALLLGGCTGKTLEVQGTPHAVADSGTPVPSTPAEKPPVVYTNTMIQNRVEIDAQLAKIIQSYGVLGCGVVAFEHDSIVYSNAGGYARRQFAPFTLEDGTVEYRVVSSQKATTATKYRIASISKLVTVVLAMQLVEQGKLSLKDDVALTIHEKLRNPSYPQIPTTLEMLMTHTSGIVDGAGYNYALNTVPFPPLDAVLARNNFTGEEPGTAYHYSNFGMGLVSAAIEKASGRYFYDYARDALFTPLGVDAAYITDYIQNQALIASFQWEDPLSWGSMKYLYGQIPQGQMYLLGHGELYISAEDLAKIAIILAGDGTYQGKRYLTQESVDNIHQKRVYDPVTNVSRGLAVQISPDIVEGVTLYGHQGNAYGAISCMFYDPITERGVVLLTNGASSARVESQVYAMNDAVVKLLWKYL